MKNEKNELIVMKKVGFNRKLTNDAA